MKRKNNKKGNNFAIQVSLRIKPVIRPNGSIDNAYSPKNMKFSSTKNTIDLGGRKFKFNNVLGPSCTQDDTYGDIVPDLLSSLKKGFDSCIFAYGQTGSGKTHTLLGAPGCLTEECIKRGDIGDFGLLPRIMLEMIEMQGVDICVSAVEIYFGSVFDLLNNKSRVNVSCASYKVPGGRKPVWKKDRFGGNITKKMRDPKFKFMDKKEGNDGGFKMMNQKEVVVKTPKDVAKLLRKIETTRIASGHALNHRSSRSHCVVTLKMIGGNIRNKFLCIDLAGSERVKKSQVKGAKLHEAVCTNKSLSTLGRVILALSRGKPFVPYRDSTLTLLMRDALGGNCRTHMVCNVSQEDIHFDETLSTTQFGERCSMVKNKNVKVKKVELSKEVQELERRITFVEQELELMRKNGKSGGLDMTVAQCTRDSFTRNKEILENAKRELTETKGKINEYKKIGKNSSHLQKKVQNLENTIHIHTGIVARMMLSGLYKEPHVSFINKKGELNNLKDELKRLLKVTKGKYKFKDKKFEKETDFRIKQWRLDFC